ncbi:MAG TPA: rubredoxin [Desulfobacteraceae bacterium]|nr:rubredoxin [Desulfobacteraceae bacterium]|tara:strand:+ start:753 stop:1424 length:672 start_codon:yes stop_codon:yes gene_type:complete
MKKWQCTVCKFVHEGDEPPDKCPVCGVSGDKFILLEDPPDTPDTQVPEKGPEPAAVSAQTTSGPEATTEPEDDQPEAPRTPYEKIVHLLVKHHAHPVSVHMPNGILPVSVALFILAWVFDLGLFVKAGFINLVFVVLAFPLVLFSGILEWKKKYAGGLTLIFKLKILAATVTTTACIISVIWYMADPLVLETSLAWVFILLNIVMLAAAGVAGHIGGKLVFKD